MANRNGRLADELEWHQAVANHAIVRLDGSALASFRPAGPRVLSRLALLDERRFVDITIQPETIGQLVRGAATRRRRDPNAWDRSIARRLVTAAGEWGIDDLVAEDGGRLAATLVSAGFPLVRMARQRGVLPPPFVPRWAERILACADTRTAAVGAFGASSSRRVVRSLPASLIGDPSAGAGSLKLMPLAFALALRDLVGPDALANVLDAPSADHLPHHWPTVDGLIALRRVFHELGPDPAVAIAKDALTSVEGPGRLVALAVHVRNLDVAQLGPPPLRLDELERVVIGLERATYARPRVPRRPDAPVRERPAANDLPAVPRHPPRVAPVARRQPGDFDYPPAVRRIDGARTGDHRLALPTNPAELEMWGRQLDNCLADFGPAVAAGRSVVVGLRRNERLVAAFELDGDLTRVRQFVRTGNQRPYGQDRDAVTRLLRQLGIVDQARARPVG